MIGERDVQLLGYGLAVLMGLALGTLGGGGSILTVPILVYVVGYEPKQAIGMSLAVVGVTAAIGAVGHHRAGNVRLRRAAVFAGAGVAGSAVGTRAATLVSGPVQLTLFAAIMVLAAGVMLRGARPTDIADPPSVPHRPLLRTAIDGLGIGALTGLVGVGGGFLIVPALVVLGGLPMHQAVGTSL
ncbi:MAG TPA: sulfite exporter TauE/SafE family protein, partial [Methylomirabilota bacterium]|nr:sulfite exporter TauE/SafE family protein [Methylomirabilota bacterium]